MCSYFVLIISVQVKEAIKKAKKKKKSVFSTTLNVCVKRCYSNKMQTLKAKAEFISTILNHIMHSSFYVVIWEIGNNK